MSQRQKIAILRALQLGDLMVATPALRSIRAGHPDAEITLIGLPWAASFAQRFDHYIDDFVPFPGYPGLREQPLNPDRTAQFLAEQRARQYDLVVQMHGSGESSNPCAFALGAAETAGFFIGDRPEGLTIGAPYPSHLPEIERNLALARLLGCPDCGTELEFPISPSDRREAGRILSHVDGPRPWIGVHPGASSPARRWPVERFAAVADALACRFNALIIVTGGPDEVPVAETLAARMNAPSVVVAGQTTLGGLAALIDRLDLFVSNDTGPAHIAVATGTPSVTIFGPADPARWGHLDRERHPVLRAEGAGLPRSSRAWVEPLPVISAACRLLMGSPIGERV